ncbi:MAG: hypothetical protein KDA58_06600 [Planctomycetaceae bacterium]|nr:hypothetical protein [Planctomycetaceae bacterium]
MTIRAWRSQTTPRQTIDPLEQTWLLECDDWLRSARLALSTESGVLARLDSIQTEAALNRLPPEELQRPVASLIATLKLIDQQELARLQQSLLPLASTLAAARNPTLDPSEQIITETDLIPVELAHQAVVEAWNELILQLRRWTHQHNYLEQFDELYAGAHELRQQNLILAQQTIARTLATLDPPQRRELQRLSTAYQRLAIHGEQLQLPLPDPEAAALQFVAVQQRFVAGAVPTRLMHIADQISTNSMGIALQQSAQLQELLDQLHRQLHETSPPASDSLVRELQQQREAVEQFLSEEQRLQQSLSTAEFSADSASQERLQRLIKETETLLSAARGIRRDLHQLREPGLAHEMSHTERDLEQARARLGQQQGQLALEHLQQAINRSSQLLDSLRQREQQLFSAAQTDHLAEQTRRFLELAERQRQLAEQGAQLSSQLGAPISDAPQWTRPLLRQLVALEQTHRTLADDLRALRLQVTDLSLVQHVTERLQREMIGIADDLQRRQVSANVYERQRNIAHQLDLIAQSLTSQSLNLSAHGDPQSTPPSDTPPNPASRQLTAEQTGELQLLLALLEDVASRTKSLSTNAALNPEEHQLREAELQSEQTQLTAWLKALLRPTAPE